jgi:hypothetical protein
MRFEEMMMNKKLAVMLTLAAFGLAQVAPVAAQTTPNKPAQTSPKKATPKKAASAKKKTPKKSAKPAAAKPKTSSLVSAKAVG